MSAERGHQVVLFEAGAALGGQILLAARATWRRELAGIAQWLAGRIERLGVEIRLNVLAEEPEVLAERPDVVVVATGGLPNPGHFEGKEHAATVWEALGGQVEAGGEVLVYDENGSHQGPSCAEHLASRGAQVEIVTPDRALCSEMADTNQGSHLSELYRHHVRIRPDTRLTEVRREGQPAARRPRQHVHRRARGALRGPGGRRPRHAAERRALLRPQAALEEPGRSRSGGHGRSPAQRLAPHPEGDFQLFRVGDAWTSRNIHAAMLDSLRLCKDL